MKEIFKRSPAEISTAIITVVDLAIILSWIEMSTEAVAALNIALATVLGLFYVKSQTTNTAELAEVKAAQDDAFMFGADVAAPTVGHADEVTVMESSGSKNIPKTGEAGQASLPVILIVLAVICALIGLWTAAKFLIIVAAVIVVVALVVGSRSRV